MNVRHELRADDANTNLARPGHGTLLLQKSEALSSHALCAWWCGAFRRVVVMRLRVPAVWKGDDFLYAKARNEAKARKGRKDGKKGEHTVISPCRSISC